MPTDYNALAAQAGAISNSKLSGKDYSALARQAGAISSRPPDGSDAKAQPDFTQRLLEAFGLPGTIEQAQASAPQTFTDALRQGAAASTGLLPAIVNYGKQVYRGASEGNREAQEAAQNIGEGGPVGANILKAGGGLLRSALSTVPFVGEPIQTAGEDVSQKNYSGAAGGLTGIVAQVPAPKLIEGAGKVAGKTADVIKSNFAEPPKPALQPEVPKPVSSPLPVDSPFDDATIRKTSGKDLNPSARETLRNAAGPIIPAGSSPELHLLKAVPEVNATIATESTKLAKILEDNGPLSTTPETAVTTALDNLRESLPGGTEESFGKAIDKELAKAKSVLGSTDPVAINDYIRTLDKSVNSYTAPEEGIDSPSNAADAARVTIRRALRDTINSQIPETKPIDKVLGDNIEVRSVRRKRLGAVADDSAAAQSQYSSELRKGHDQLSRDSSNAYLQEEYEARKARNKGRRNLALGVAGGAGALQVGKEVLKNLVL